MSDLSPVPIGPATDELPNALEIKVVESGRILVELLNGKTAEGATCDSRPNEPSQKRARTATSDLQPQDDTETTQVPDSVLQYERQLRKVQANHRSLAPLSMKEHFSIVFEDEDIIVTNKPSGILCVPGLHDKPNLLNLICEHANIQTENPSSLIVHRLDMDTSGLVLYAKSARALKPLQAAFRERQVDKEYHALLCGHLPLEWERVDIHLALQRDHRHPPFMRIATPRSEAEAAVAVQQLQTRGFQKLVKKNPKPSHTELAILAREHLVFQDGNVKLPVTRVSLIPHTGRTHQLRVHCAALGYPIVGDPAYGLFGEAHARGGLDDLGSAVTVGAPLSLQQQLTTLRPPRDHTMCLHAARLSLRHPVSGEPQAWQAVTPF